jgi:hypothetical protein
VVSRYWLWNCCVICLNNLVIGSSKNTLVVGKLFDSEPFIENSPLQHRKQASVCTVSYRQFSNVRTFEHIIIEPLLGVDVIFQKSDSESSTGDIWRRGVITICADLFTSSIHQIPGEFDNIPYVHPTKYSIRICRVAQYLVSVFGGGPILSYTCVRIARQRSGASVPFVDNFAIDRKKTIYLWI